MKDIKTIIEKRISEKFADFKTDRDFITQKFNDIKRADIKPYSVNVSISGNEYSKEDNKIISFSESKIKKDLNSLLRLTYSSFKAIDLKDNNYEYVIVNTSEQEFYNLKRIEGTQFFYNVVEQKILKIDYSQVDVSTKEEAIKLLETIENDNDIAFKEESNGFYLINIFMFVRLL